MAIWAFDIETVINCFTVTFVNVEDPRQVRQFVSSSLEEFIKKECYFEKKDMLRGFMQNLSEDDTLVGFNSLNFDLPILSKVFNHCYDFEDVSKMAYEMAQKIVQEEVKIPIHVEWLSRGVKHLDLFKIHHFDNEAKRTSLKWIQCHLNMDNVADMPHEHDKPVTSLKQIKEILSYNLNDVFATVQLYSHPKTQDLINLRRWAINKYSLMTGYNTSNAHMGETVFLSQLGSIPPANKEISPIRAEALLIPSIELNTRSFKRIHDLFKQTIIKAGVSISMCAVYDGMNYKFGLGGIHAAREDSIAENIDSVDVKSFYPNIAIQFGFKPKHVGEKFTKIYKNLYDERMATKNKVHNNGLKESLNSVFGKSNSEFSPLYDPSFTYSITINGQLLIAELCEKITESGAGKIIMANTDGIEVQVNQRDLFDSIVKTWSDKYKMPLSFSKYKKLIIRDVNNYIGIHEDNSIKTKGAYEIDKEFHKDPSAKICAIAVKDYYLHNIPIEKTIDTWPDISAFFLFRRAKTGKFIGVPRDGSDSFELPKTIRYLITKEGFVFYHLTDSVKNKIHIDGYITIYNNKDVIEDIEIDKGWYKREAKKLLVQPSLTLFT